MNTQNKVAIVGMGAVGKSMLKIFPDAVQFDEPLKIGSRKKVNDCDLAVVCVPTPTGEDGRCNTKIVESVVEWIQCPLILIKSAVEPRTTDKLREKYDKHIVVSPEYIGESAYYIPDRFLAKDDPLKHEFLILGGTDEDCVAVADIFAPRVGPVTRIRIMRAVEAELIKYAENAFFAVKVSYANELRELCDAMGANWHRVREGWIDDPRIGAMHTAVFPRHRGFDGKCYPKDTLALAKTGDLFGVDMCVVKGALKANTKYVK
jgi:UDPglucose 6-dehydrogenase